jgi:hypothetical protein
VIGYGAAKRPCLAAPLGASTRVGEEAHHMTEDTSDSYVYVKNWSLYRPRKDRPNYDWLQLHTSLLGHPKWIKLSPADRCLLITIWMLCQRHGNGRLAADQRWLCAQAAIPWSPNSRNLERLIQAGFIEVSATKGPPVGRRMVGLEEKIREKEDKERSAHGAEAPADFPENGRPVKTIAQMEEIERIAREHGFIE